MVHSSLICFWLFSPALGAKVAMLSLPERLATSARSARDRASLASPTSSLSLQMPIWQVVRTAVPPTWALNLDTSRVRECANSCTFLSSVSGVRMAKVAPSKRAGTASLGEAFPSSSPTPLITWSAPSTPTSSRSALKLSSSIRHSVAGVALPSLRNCCCSAVIKCWRLNRPVS